MVISRSLRRHIGAAALLGRVSFVRFVVSLVAMTRARNVMGNRNCNFGYNRLDFMDWCNFVDYWGNFVDNWSMFMVNLVTNKALR